MKQLCILCTFSDLPYTWTYMYSYGKPYIKKKRGEETQVFLLTTMHVLSTCYIRKAENNQDNRKIYYNGFNQTRGDSSHQKTSTAVLALKGRLVAPVSKKFIYSYH